MMTTTLRKSRFLHPDYDQLAARDQCPCCQDAPGLLVQDGDYGRSRIHFCGMCNGDGVHYEARQRLGVPRFGARSSLWERQRTLQHRASRVKAAPSKGWQRLMDRLARMRSTHTVTFHYPSN